MTKIYNIDWLQFSAFIDIEMFNSTIILQNYKLETCNFSTRHFKIIKNIIDTRQNKQIAVITYLPHSSAISKNLALIKFDNWVLYQNYLINYIYEFIDVFKIQFNNLSRIDVCIDFQRIDYRNQKPDRFIKSFLSGYYQKLRKSKGQVYFNIGEKLDFQYIKFGSGKSRVCSYIYNKTIELEQVRNKPHISELWRKNNFNEDVWRCEFRIQNFDFLLTDEETGEQITFNGNLAGLKSFDVIKNVKPLFDALAKHYLTFKISGSDSNKSRLSGFRLFNESDKYQFNKTYNDNIEAGRSEKIFIKKLYELNNELKGSDHELGMYGKEVLMNVINATELTEWAKHKQII